METSVVELLDYLPEGEARGLGYGGAIEPGEIGDDVGRVRLVREGAEGGEVRVGEEVGPAAVSGSSGEGRRVALNVHMEGGAGEGDGGGEGTEEVGGGEALTAGEAVEIGPLDEDGFDIVLLEKCGGVFDVRVHVSNRLHG